MTEIPKSRVTWGKVLLAAFALFLGVVAAFKFRPTKTDRAPAAFLIPASEECHVSVGYFSGPLHKPRTLERGAKVRVDVGSRVTVLRLDGTNETVEGPAVVAISDPTAVEHDYLRTPFSKLLLASDELPVAGPGVRIYSPAGVTMTTIPLLDWELQPGHQYDVAVVDPADAEAPPKLLQKVEKPVLVSELDTTGHRKLRKDRLYEVWVRETGNQQTLGVQRFLVSGNATEAPGAGTPAEKIVQAYKAMSQPPYATGDAYVALKSLPAAWLKSELGVRLRWAVAVQLGLESEVRQTRQEAAGF